MRDKLDPRLSFLLSLRDGALEDLKPREGLGDIPRAAGAAPVVFLELGGSLRPGEAG